MADSNTPHESNPSPTDAEIQETWEKYFGIRKLSCITPEQLDYLIRGVDVYAGARFNTQPDDYEATSHHARALFSDAEKCVDLMDTRYRVGTGVLQAIYFASLEKTNESVYGAIEDIKLILEHLLEAFARNRKAPYQDYLNTMHWFVTRESALQRADYCCQLCGSPDRLNVHHKSYARLYGETESDLIVLCRDCHAKFHGKLP